MITIEKKGSAISFTFDGNDHYLQEGTIEVPVNSLALIIDESDMFTFRKAQSNDIFISANYDDIGMSKEQLIQFYKNNMVASNGDSSISEIYVGTSGDTVDPSSGIVTKLEGKKEWLCIVYKDQQGMYSMTKVNLNEFIIEGEFEDGLYVDSEGTVHGQVDANSEKVYTAYDASGNPSTSASVLSVGANGFKASNIQLAINKKTEKAVYHLDYVWDNVNKKMKVNYSNQQKELLDFIELFDTDTEGRILLPNERF